MSTIYSLICFGGKDGKTVTFTDAGDVVNLTNHGLRNGTGVVFTDNGNTLPAGLSKNTTYYAKQGADANKFTLWTTSALTTQVTFTGTGSGTHKVKSAYYVGLSDKSRWTYGGTERVYDGLISWRAARITGGSDPASAYDSEVCEIGMAWDEITSTKLILNLQCASTTIVSSINGGRTGAFHSGVYGAGYSFVTSLSFDQCVLLSGYYHVVDGITIRVTAGSATAVAFTNGLVNTIQNCFIVGNSTATGQIGVNCNSPVNSMINCVVAGVQTGLSIIDYASSTGSLIANCTVVKCAAGVSGGSGSKCFMYNVASVGNTINWTSNPTALNGAAYNGGSTGNQPWYTGTDTSVKTLTADNSTFADYDNNDFKPAGDTVAHTSSSVIVDSGTPVPQIDAEDIAEFARPAYKNGSAESWDIGAFEFDWGYTRPNSVTVSLSGMVDGSRVAITKQSDGTEIRNELLSSETTDSFSYDTSSDVPVYLWLRKGSSSVFYHPVKVAATILADGGLTYSFSGLQVEDIAAATYDAQIDTDWGINWSTGAITHDSGTTRYSVQGIYSMHQNESDSDTNIDAAPLMHGTTPTQFELINSGDISDADLEDLYGGSIEFQDGTLWSNLWTTDTMASSHDVYVVQDGAKYTSFWSSGPIDVLLKVKDAGTLIDSGLVTAYARPYGYTFGQYTADLSSGGRTVAPILTAVDATCQSIDPSGFTDITVTFGLTSKDFGDGDGAQTYYCVVDCNNRPLSEVYARLMYLCRDVSTATLNGVEGWQYAKAHSSYTANTSAPFGNYVGGTWSVAQGVWLDNVRGLDYLDYILTDHAGGTHQNVSSDLATGLVSGLVAGSRIQIYNVTTATEMYNDIVAGTSYSTEYENGTGYTNGDTIRVRCAWMSGTSAKLPVQYTTIATTAGWSVLASQEDDEIYNANAIDGDTVTEFAADYPNVQIDINDLDGATTPQRGYAWYISGQMTADGIRYYHGSMTAEDAGNYRINVSINDMHIQNVSTSPVYISGARLYRSDGTRVTAAGNGPIEMEYGRVFTTTVTLSGESVVTGTAAEIIAAIPSTTANAAAILAAAQVTPIRAITQDNVIEGTLTEAEAQRIMLAALAGRVTKSGTNIKFKSVDGLTDRIDGTVDTEGNRTAVTLDGAA